MACSLIENDEVEEGVSCAQTCGRGHTEHGCPTVDFPGPCIESGLRNLVDCGAGNPEQAVWVLRGCFLLGHSLRGAACGEAPVCGSVSDASSGWQPAWRSRTCPMLLAMARCMMCFWSQRWSGQPVFHATPLGAGPCYVLSSGGGGPLAMFRHELSHWVSLECHCSLFCISVSKRASPFSRVNHDFPISFPDSHLLILSWLIG